MSLWGRGPAGSSCPPSGSAGLPRARRAGRLGTAIVRQHKHPSVCVTPPPLLSPSPDLTGVAGWGAGWGPGCPGLRVSRPVHSLWPFCFTSVPTPPPSVSSSFIKRAFAKCLCVLGGVFLCYASGFGVSASVGRLLLSLLPYLVLGNSKGQSLARSILSPVSSATARSPLSHFPAPYPPPHDSVPFAAYDSAPPLVSG